MFKIGETKKYDFIEQYLSSDVYEDVYKIYDRIFSSLTKDMPYIHNIRVILPNIYVNYDEFNRARNDAFDKYQYNISLAPVSTCVGSKTANIIEVNYQIGKYRPTIINNPRQILPKDYPDMHGKNRPIFSRAAIIEDKLQISGTASIVGSMTIHHRDFHRQLCETLLNLDSIVYQVNKQRNNLLDISDLQHTVYLKDVANKQAALEIMKRHAGIQPDKIKFIEANICRPDLLVEIEAWEV